MGLRIIFTMKDAKITKILFVYLYDASVKVMTRDGVVEEKVLQAVIDDARRTAGVKKEVRSGDYSDFRFLRKAREQLKGSGWRP